MEIGEQDFLFLKNTTYLVMLVNSWAQLRLILHVLDKGEEDLLTSIGVFRCNGCMHSPNKIN
jgi:hypothetical protein